ncbi:MAG: hypothetical protein IJ849_10775 [Selenomonadaceae bacterium]|nr:hypothetical protein [Selenomonadaceae bacterium]
MATAGLRMDNALFNTTFDDEQENTAQQINFFAKVGKNALANPDLPVYFVRDLLIARDEPTEPFVLED